jgi:thiamine-phosphate pyrophosphorylase
MLIYAITDRSSLAEEEEERAEKLLELASKWVENGVDFIQIREKDLPFERAKSLAERVAAAVRKHEGPTRVLLNAASENAFAAALEAGVDGIHLPGGLDPQELATAVSRIRQKLFAPAPISVSCHSAAEVKAARDAGATLALFAPVFEKRLPQRAALPGRGLEALANACRAGSQAAPQPPLPVLALGGVTLENISQCLAAGADGIAAIHLLLDGGGSLKTALSRCEAV